MNEGKIYLVMLGIGYILGALTGYLGAKGDD